MRSFDLKYSDVLNDDGIIKKKIRSLFVCFFNIYFKDLPDRSCVFYVNHPSTLSTGNIRDFFTQWNLLSYDRFDLTTHIIAVSLKKDTIDTSRKFCKISFHLFSFYSFKC
jgi:hypothetical protein